MRTRLITQPGQGVATSFLSLAAMRRAFRVEFTLLLFREPRLLSDPLYVLIILLAWRRLLDLGTVKKTSRTSFLRVVA